jgi:beta-xylosidase
MTAPAIARIFIASICIFAGVIWSVMFPKTADILRPDFVASAAIGTGLILSGFIMLFLKKHRNASGILSIFLIWSILLNLFLLSYAKYAARICFNSAAQSDPQDPNSAKAGLDTLYSEMPIAKSKVWVADNNDGTYKNPILYADYSDPDVIRVGDDYYMTASSFSCIPGLPILQSKDLVNWTIIGHALQKYPDNLFSKPQPGKGVWAPSIRYHNNCFYIYWGDPDIGIFMVKSRTAAGRWEKPILVLPGKGLIDPCPLWDDDGNAYLVHAWAFSRAGIKSLLTVRKMNPEGTVAAPEGVNVFDGHEHHPTVEGPKFYKRNGYYYIFAPAGGVKTGWQLVLRSKNIYGPYEVKVVLDQGTTAVNGPHQGGWVDTPLGQSWFIHFQDIGAYGRVVHLEPVQWIDDWPVIGIDNDKDGKGQPVMQFKKPQTSQNYPVMSPPESDEFNTGSLGLQWQWQANPQSGWYELMPRTGFLRLFAINSSRQQDNLAESPNVLLQKFPAPDFTATTKIKFTASSDGKRAGLVIMGSDYASVYIMKKNQQLFLVYAVCTNALQNSSEQVLEERPLQTDSVYLRVKVLSPDARCQFSYSVDGIDFEPLANEFKAKGGKWIGAKVGLFCASRTDAEPGGYADFDWFRIE